MRVTKKTGVKWISEIPIEWNMFRLQKYFSERSEKVDDVTFPPLSVTKSGIVDQLSKVAKSNNGDNRKLVRKNDFVINSRSDRKGSSGIAPRDGSVSEINIVIESRELILQFIQHLLKSYYFKEEFFRNGKGICWDLWTTRWDQLKNIYIPIPPLKQQNLISQYLDSKIKQIDSLIEKLQNKIELLEELRKSIINQSVTKGLDLNIKMKHSGVKWIGEIPQHWKTTHNKRLFTDNFGGSWGNDPNDNQNKDLVRVIRVTDFDITNLSVSTNIPTMRSLQLSSDSKKLVKKNDLILEKSGGGEKSPVGKVVMVNQNIDFPTINSNFTNICRPNTKAGMYSLSVTIHIFSNYYLLPTTTTTLNFSSGHAPN